MDLNFLTSTGDAAWAVDGNQVVVGWNPAAQALFGYSAQETIGQPCHEIICGKTLSNDVWCQRFCAVLIQAQKNRRVDSAELEVRHQGGHTVTISLSTIIVPVAQDNGQTQVIIHLARPLKKNVADSQQLRIYLLGRTSVERADGSLVGGPLWRRIKVKGLMAYLSLMKGRPAHREKLLEAFWPDKSRAAALHNLNTAVYNLRRCLEPQLSRGSESKYILYKSSFYQLNCDYAKWVDAHMFVDGISQARREIDQTRAVETYQKALSHYKGELLADLGTSVEWHLGEQERLSELYLMGLEELGLHFEKQGNTKRAGDSYLRALAHNPCQEKACQGLMRLALLQGDYAAANRHYKRLAAALEVQMAVSPGLETRRLYQIANSNLPFTEKDQGSSTPSSSHPSR